MKMQDVLVASRADLEAELAAAGRNYDEDEYIGDLRSAVADCIAARDGVAMHKIIWQERQDGTGEYVLICDDGRRESIPAGEPIGPTSDSSGIAALFGQWSVVDHDRDVIHVSE